MVRKLVNYSNILLVIGVGIYVLLKQQPIVLSALFVAGLVGGWCLIEAESRLMVLAGEHTLHQFLYTPVVLMVFFFFSLFLLSTSASPIARGIVLGFGLRVFITVLRLLKKPTMLKHTFFWQIDGMTARQMQWIGTVYICVFLLLVAIS